LSLVRSIWGPEFHWAEISNWLNYLDYLRTQFLREYCYDCSSPLPSYYHIVRKLSSILDASNEFSCVISDAGSSWYVVGQALQTSSSVQLVTSASLGGMGYALPALIGVTLSANKPAIAVTGDGSLQMCSQELPTFAALNCPSVLLLVNNSGYMSIRNTQNKFCSGRLIGTDSRNNVFLPSYEKLCSCYGINYLAVRSTQELDDLLDLDFASPTIVEVSSQPNEALLPAAGSKLDVETGNFHFAGLSNMTPVVNYLSFNDFVSSSV
jgi:acetolactate synthase I/II/III large subunit